MGAAGRGAGAGGVRECEPDHDPRSRFALASNAMIASYFPAASQIARHALLECGGELGSFVLWGQRRAESWQFQTVATDWAPCLRALPAGGAAPLRTESPWVCSWSAALDLLDQRPWENLIPGTVHASFAEPVLAAVLQRLAGRQDERARRQRERWTFACRPRRLEVVD